ncbi:MAG: DUF4912 domain-containing protein [Candidatus Omnitrophica bacterium]|nr:DUF4912 domain-containing protein [Candidatus Omnitrophota bacterium]
MAILPKRKEKTKKINRKKDASLRISAKKIARKISPAQIKKQMLGVEELVIENTKFSQSEAPRPRRHFPQDLPYQYDQDKIILQVRDPWCCHTYWELKVQTLDRLRNELGEEFYHAKRILRVYDVSQITFNGNNAHRFFDIQINELANNWYIDTGSPGRSWCVDLGLLLPCGKFITMVRSNTVHTPLAGPSWITDEEWMIPEDMFARLYGMGFGFGRSSPVGRAWQERYKALFSGILASPGITSMASPVKKPGKRGFWLVANCELIVYGATEPDAKVTIQGKTINLRQDGSFTLRFALPDGKQVIPIKAVSSDNEEERSITPIVTRETK